MFENIHVKDKFTSPNLTARLGKLTGKQYVVKIFISTTFHVHQLMLLIEKHRSKNFDVIYRRSISGRILRKIPNLNQ